MGFQNPTPTPRQRPAYWMPFTAACLLATALLATPGTAQRRTTKQEPPSAEQQQQFQERLEQYLQRPFIKNARWQTSWQESLDLAKREDRFILGYFTFSFADNPGLATIETGALGTPEFAALAKAENAPVLFLHVMSRLPDRDNDDMRKLARSRGLPAIVFFAPDGSWAAKQAMGHLEQFTAADIATTHDALLTVRRADRAAKDAEGAEPPAAAELLHAELVLGKLDFTTADRRRQELKEPPEALMRAINKRINRLELDHLSIMFREKGIDAAGPLYVKMLDEGRAPTDNSNESFGFWGNLINYALGQGDIPLAQQGLAGLRKAGKDRPLLANAIRSYEQRVERAVSGGR